MTPVATDPVLQVIVEALAEPHAVEAIYLFGSRARGHASARSDYDIGILPRRGISLSPLELQQKLINAGIDNGDVVVIDPENVVLTHEIVKHRQPLFHSPTFSPEEFFVQAKGRYLDFKPYLSRQREALKRRLSHA